MPYIYLFLSSTETYTSKMIRFSTAETFTHIALVFDPKLTKMYSFARTQPLFPLPAGFIEENIASGFYKNHPHTPCLLLRLPVDQRSLQLAQQQIFAMLTMRNRYRYNLLGLFLCRLNIENKRPWHFFCSQFVSEILENAQAVTLPKRPSLMHPADFLQLTELEVVFDGSCGQLQHYLAGASADGLAGIEQPVGYRQDLLKVIE
ncbi:hypothetical protein [Enterococcus mediterraneensis]|uniref:hypothetical protein n=1 Tax=Enterococcus mediterraneensis TaxID=2364791 RepID=UPI000F06021F|nr:hypothetical protein [Enterococcus mediterraneensis]